jgi:hypothetical protein
LSYFILFYFILCLPLFLFCFVLFIYLDVCLFPFFSETAWPIRARLVVLGSRAKKFGQLRGQLARSLAAMR